MRQQTTANTTVSFVVAKNNNLHNHGAICDANGYQWTSTTTLFSPQSSKPAPRCSSLVWSVRTVYTQPGKPSSLSELYRRHSQPASTLSTPIHTFLPGINSFQAVAQYLSQLMIFSIGQCCYSLWRRSLSCFAMSSQHQTRETSI